MKFIYLLAAILLEVFGSSMLLASDGFSKWKPTILMAISFFACFFFLSKALQYMPMGVAYAIWSGLGLVLNVLVSMYFFNQKIDLPAVIGIGFIIVGVLIMNLLSKTVAP